MPDDSQLHEAAEPRLLILRREIQNWIRWHIHSQFTSPEMRAKLPGGGPTEWTKVDSYMDKFAPELWALVPEPMKRELNALEARVRVSEGTKVRSYSSENEVPDAYWYAEGEIRRIIDRPFLRIKLGVTDSGIMKLIEEGKLKLTAKLLQKEIYLREEFEKLETERKLEAEKKAEATRLKRPIMGWKAKNTSPGSQPPQ
jgi:hypothetical protein